MRVPRHAWFVPLVFAVMCVLKATAICESDQAAAERVLGPQWKHLSRRAGMVFAGTALGEGIQNARMDRGVPSIALRFRIDRAIAGVESGQVLTVREWAGAASLLLPIHRGEHFLLFLYPPSGLGLTSPVGGLQGQVRLDVSGRNAADWQRSHQVSVPASSASSRPTRNPVLDAGVRRIAVTVDQLERAIRSARSER
jgi:hypothetical protein